MAITMKLIKLNSVFEVQHGNKLDLNKMEQCSPRSDAIAFVGRSGEENGIVGFVERSAVIEPFAPGLITVALGGAALATFVQPRTFYTAQNIDVLSPLEPMTLDTKLYYCLCIEANRFRYSTFGREANRTLKNLLVPQRKDVPRWVAGTSEAAVQELRNDLATVILEAE
jgi:hypothetical protein